MNILWITSILFPEASSLLCRSKDFKTSGGWLLGASKALVSQQGVRLFVATPSFLVKDLVVLQGELITYYIFPLGKGNDRYDKNYELYLSEVYAKTKPDVVHIHGTEYPQGLAYVKACGSDKVIVSIQGMKSAYNYYYYGLSRWDVIKNITLRDLYKGTIFQRARRFYKSSQIERELLRRIRHVIGRTSWDKAQVWSINPNANYFFCNETLRDEFYDGSKWDYNKCIRHTIFVSQANYPIKGFHQLLKAMPLVLQHYPDATIRVAGLDITRKNTKFGSLMLTGYGKIIKMLSHEYQLTERISFVGELNANQMKREYLNCNVFVCPSTIENSPNSLGEAQILGVPCVASYVGGIPDMMRGDEINLYRFEDTVMLAKKICDIFDTPDGGKMIEVAKKRHDRTANAIQLYNIYKKIIKLQ